MNLNWLCKIGYHKYKFVEYFPEWMQPHTLNKDMHWKTWKTKCQRCGKESSDDNMIK